MLEHFDKICDSPAQIYHYALPFCPSSSWLQKCYTAELSQVVSIVKGTSTEWGACSRTVTFEGNPQVISYGNGTIAVGFRLESNNIVILDAITGSQTAVLSGHTDWVRSLVFSSDRNLLVSGSSDKTVKLWDMQTGGVIETFRGNTEIVLSVSISADCTMIASGASNGKICLWDIQTGQCHHFWKLDTLVKYVCFPPINPECLISITNFSVQQWDFNGCQSGPTYNGYHIVFSPDCAQFALCGEESIIIKNSFSGATITEIYSPNGDDSLPEDNSPPEDDGSLLEDGSITFEKHFPSNICFSPDGRLLAASYGDIGYVWDVSNPEPHLFGRLRVYFERITTLVFSSPSILISTSNDKGDDGAVEYWQVSDLSTDPVLSALGFIPSHSASIKFVSLQVSQGIAISGDSTGIIKAWDISNGSCKATFQTPLTEGYKWRCQTNRWKVGIHLFCQRTNAHLG